MAKLIVFGENAPLKEIELGALTTVGRHPSQSVQLLDRLVSKEHAIIEIKNGVVSLKDLGSRNGTFVNNRPVTETRLGNGDKVLFGSTRCVFYDASMELATGNLTRVTIAPEIVQSAIAARVVHTQSREFSPESQITQESELRRDYERLRMAYRLQREIALEVDLERLLQKVMDSLFESLKCDRGAILLIDAETAEFETRCVKVRDERRNEDGPQDIKISRTLLDQVIRDKMALLSSDATIDDRLAGAQSIILQGIRSTMSVPLMIHEEVLGIIHLDSLFATGIFTDRDLNIVQGLAHQAAIAIENSRLVKQREADAALREKFSRLLSPVLVDELVAGKIKLARGGQSRRCTVLFSDLRDFTAMSQRKAASEVVAMLNEYFEIMVDIVFEFEGTVDKFMGDGLMAVWGAPVGIEDAAMKAVTAALRMRQALAEWNEQRIAEGQEPMRMGVGIDTGELVAGTMGSSKTMNYTVIGSPVNLASRLCGVAAADQVLVSSNTLKELDERVTYDTLAPIALKGIGERVTPYNVLSLSGSLVTTLPR